MDHRFSTYSYYKNGNCLLCNKIIKKKDWPEHIKSKLHCDQLKKLTMPKLERQNNFRNKSKFKQNIYQSIF
jgi:hypothetical protein